MFNFMNKSASLPALFICAALYSCTPVWANCDITDDYPNQIDVAAELSDGSITDGRIALTQDRDVFTLRLIPTGTYTFSIRGIGGDALESVELRLFDEDGITELDYVTNADGTVLVSFSYTNGSTEKDVYLDVRSFAELNNGDYRLLVDEVVFPDGDNDGLPTYWEELYGLSDSASGGNNGFAGDPDGDGHTNGEEFALGTDPTDPDSRLAVEDIVTTALKITVSFPAIAGRSYRVMKQDHMSDTGFTQVATVQANTSGMVDYEDTSGLAKPSQMYKLELIE